MPTYYNGKEIRPTSKISGISLVGKSSIKLGGRIITLSTDPPPPTLETIELYFSGEDVRDPESACFVNYGGELRILFSDFTYANTGSFLFEDVEGTIVFDGKDSFYFDPQQNVVFQVDPNGMIGPLNECRR